jgi:hypothetical protein
MRTTALLAVCFIGTVAHNQIFDYNRIILPVYAKATNQKYRNYSTFAAHAEVKKDDVVFGTFNRIDKDNVDWNILRSAAQGQVKTIDLKWDDVNPDFAINMTVNTFRIQLVQNTWFPNEAKYSVSYDIDWHVMNRQRQIIQAKNYKTTQEELVLPVLQLGAQKSDRFTTEWDCQIRLELFKRVLRSVIASFSKDYVNGKKEIMMALPFCANANAKKKFPDLAFMDSTNLQLANLLRTISPGTDYVALTAPFIDLYKNKVAEVYPEKYRKEHITFHCLLMLSNLYFIASNYDAFKKYTDSAELITPRRLGMSFFPDESHRMREIVNGYYATVGQAAEESKAIALVDKLAELNQKEADAYAPAAMLALLDGSTISGRYILDKNIALKDDAVILMLLKSEGKEVKKSFTYKNIKQLVIGEKVYEPYLFNGPMDLTNNLGIGKDYRLFEVLYSSPVIKVVKDNMTKDPSNFIAFIKPSETSLTGLKRAWQKETMPQEAESYFTNCATIVNNAKNKNYAGPNWQLQVAKDFAELCK